MLPTPLPLSFFCQVSPDQLTLPVLESVYKLVNTALGKVTEKGLPPLIKHVLFNFRIWAKPSYAVRSGESEVAQPHIVLVYVGPTYCGHSVREPLSQVQ